MPLCIAIARHGPPRLARQNCDHIQGAPCRKMNGIRCLPICARSDSPTRPRPRLWSRSMPPCSRKASICVRSARRTSILAAQGEVVERRRQRRHPVYHKPDQVTLHADRGAPMKARATALMLADPGVVKSHGRPPTSDDNPFLETHFKTLKYQPEFPKRFQTIDEARTFCRHVFAWYNEYHHHAGIGLMTPDQIHFGQAEAIHAARQTALAGRVSQHT